MTTRQKLIAAGVRNLKDFGYPSARPENILTDRIYSRFFDSMLADHEGDTVIVAKLREEIATAEAKRK